MAKKTISVLGCGWLGLPLAEKLVQLGYSVKGSTTTPAKLQTLQEKGIMPFLASFSENSTEVDLTELLKSEVLVFNIPPSKTSSETTSYEQILQSVLAQKTNELQHLIFVSSTSVYPDLNREVTEADAVAAPDSPSLLLRCEYLAQQVPGLSTTMVRYGGLMGGSRHPGRFLAGKTNLPAPNGPVNMIHLTDAVEVIIQIIAQEKWGFTFNACAPLHPTREKFYTQAAQALGLVPPTFAPNSTSGFKVINSDSLAQELTYSFQQPDPMSCLTSASF